MDRRLPAAFALGVALLLLANPLYLLPYAGQPEYGHSIERIDANDVPDDATVLEYRNLSPEARRAIDAALASEDDHAVVRGDVNKPPEFFYSDYSEPGQGLYYIAKDGAYYMLTTFAAGGFFPIDLFLQWALLLFGACLAVVAGRSLLDEQRRATAILGILGVVFLVTVASGFEPYGDLTTLAAVSLGTAASLVTIGFVLDPRHAAGVTVAFVVAILVGLVGLGWPWRLPLILATLLALFVGVGTGLKHVQPVRRLRGLAR